MSKGPWKPKTEEEKKVLAEKYRASSNAYWSNPDNREKHSKLMQSKSKICSEAMKKVVAEKPESFRGVNRGRVKCYEYNGEMLDGKWELSFARWCDENELRWERCKVPFSYEWNGTRSYFPDFICLT
jgi:hypothetical protein